MLKRLGELKPLCNSGNHVQMCRNVESSLSVRAVSACEQVDIILDSGSDVTLIPMSMSHVGCQAPQTSETYLRDAQGKRIATSDVRDVNFSFSTVDGEVVTQGTCIFQ